MTEERLKLIAKQTAAMAKTQLRTRGQLNCILAYYFEGCGLKRMLRIEKWARENLGEDWLNNGRKKDFMFGMMSFCTRLAPPEAIVVCTAVDEFLPTQLLDSLPDAEQRRIYEIEYPRDHPEWFRPRDALVVTAQTPALCCIYRQTLQGTLLVGEPDIMIGPRDKLKGRLLMFGAEIAPEIIEHIKQRFGDELPADFFAS